VEICGEAANGQDAIEKASQLTPDLIILDVTMPELDGFAAARQIRTFQPEVPIIMLSMHDGQHESLSPDSLRFPRYSGAEFLPNPECLAISQVLWIDWGERPSVGLLLLPGDHLSVL
jgi:CheY-like chemotaxis protein